MTNKTVGYVIYDPNTEELSTGGRWPSLNLTRYKIWLELGHLKSHISQVKNTEVYRGCEIRQVNLGSKVPFSKLDKKHLKKLLDGY